MHSNGKAYKIQASFPLDKKALQAMTCLGCGSHQPGHFCTYCSVKGVSKHLPAFFRCDFCLRCDPDQLHPCMHHQVLTGEEMRQAEQLADVDPLLHIIVNHPLDCGVVGLRQYVLNKLLVTHTAGGKSVLSGTVAELKSLIRNWDEVNHVDSVNITSCSMEVVKTQLSVRLPSEHLRVQFRIKFLSAEQEAADDERLLLAHVLHHAQHLEAARRIRGETPVISTPESCVLCLLHAEMRLSEKLVVLMVAVAVGGRCDLSNKEKELVRQRLEDRMCIILSSLPQNTIEGTFRRSSLRLPGFKDTPMKFQLSGVRLQKLFGRFQELICAIFDPPPRRQRRQLQLTALQRLMDKIVRAG